MYRLEPSGWNQKINGVIARDVHPGDAYNVRDYGYSPHESYETYEQAKEAVREMSTPDCEGYYPVFDVIH